MKNRLIVALDVDSLKKAKALLDALYPTVRIFKVGSQLFSGAGPEAVKMIKRKGADVFLDLKFHDIPSTVAKTIKTIARLRPLMLNIHSLGGADMVRAASGSIKTLPKNKRPILLAVTVLTSADKGSLRKLGMSRSPIKQAVYLAKLAKKYGADGVVCSPKEIRAVRNSCGKNFIIVTPGIRPAGSSSFDHKRTATPGWAIKKGADFIVVGRPITKSGNPKKAAEGIIEHIKIT